MKTNDRLRLLLGWGYNSTDIELYGFNAGRSMEDAGRYLGYDWLQTHIRPALNASPVKSLVDNKWVFYRLLDGFGLPAPRTLGLFDARHGITWDGLRRLQDVPAVLGELDSARPDGLVLKPAGGEQGKKLLILDSIDYATGRAVTRAGDETNLEEALASVDLEGMGGYSGYILQEPVTVHEAWARIAPWTANTVRVQTILGSDGDVAVQAAGARLGRRGNMADNWEQGGLSVGIDPASGVMGRGVLKKKYGGGWYTHHPDSGERFAGETVPFWDEVLDLCRRGGRLFPGLRSLGWDIVITPEGPVALETNTDWDLQLLQVHSNGFLADPVFRAQLVDLGVPLPNGKSRPDVRRRAVSRTRSFLAR